MKDNGKMGAVQHCTTCQHLGESERCQNCRNGNPPADAAAYDLMWEAAADEREFAPGEVVMWADSECTVLSVCESDGAKMLELLKIDVDKGNSGEFLLYRSLVAAAHCAKRVKELTAKEYAEKLREYFGKPEIGELDITESFCSNMDCQRCAFYTAPDTCAAVVCMFDPERALQMIREQENKKTPKGKTYLEDIRERLPNVFINKFGLPDGCRKRLCNGIVCTDCMPGMDECWKCWNEVMPEEDNAE